MMKLLMFYSICLCTSLVFTSSQTKDETHVLWKSPTQLEWKDFEGKPDDASPFKALTGWGIGYNITYENEKLTIDIECYFIPERSWVKEGHRNDYLLNHERQHFNIAQIYTRRFKKEIAEFKQSLTTVDQSIGKKINKIYAKMMDDCYAEQQRYDKETHHSINKEAQEKWDNYIAKALSK